MTMTRTIGCRASILLVAALSVAMAGCERTQQKSDLFLMCSGPFAQEKFENGESETKNWGVRPIELKVDADTIYMLVSDGDYLDVAKAIDGATVVSRSFDRGQEVIKLDTSILHEYNGASGPVRSTERIQLSIDRTKGTFLLDVTTDHFSDRAYNLHKVHSGTCQPYDPSKPKF